MHAYQMPYQVAVERDRLFVRFRKFATEVKTGLDTLGYWFEVSCPATGGCLFGERGGCTWYAFLYSCSGINHSQKLSSSFVVSHRRYVCRRRRRRRRRRHSAYTLW